MLLKEVKNAVPRSHVIEYCIAEEVVGTVVTSYEKELLKTIQKVFKVKKVIKKKVVID